MADDTDDVFPGYPVASFSVGGLKYAFPVQGVNEDGGNRIIQRERPYRDGAKLDDTGSLAKAWRMTALFNNTIDEPGLSEVNGELALYPDVLNALILAFDVHETGILTVPTVGEQPARAASYSRVEVDTMRSTATVTLTFLEDNEDEVGARIITAGSAQANAIRLANTTEFDAQSLSDWSGSMSDLTEFVSELEGLANAPSDTIADIETQNRQVQGAAKRVTKLGMDHSVPGRGLMRGPNGNATERKVVRTQAIAARTTNDARRGRPQIISIVVRRDTSLFQVAAITGQDYVDLLAINPGLDPLHIPTLSTVRVYADTGNIR